MDLRSRLARFEPLHKPRDDDRAPNPPDEAALAALGFATEATAAGPVCLRSALVRVAPPGSLAPLTRVLTAPVPADVPAGGILLLDTETTGLSGGTGTLAFLVGTAWWDGDGLRVRQYLLTSPSAEDALLGSLAELAARFAVVVTYNGQTFDLPLLRTRGILCRRRGLLDGLAGLDLLPVARRLWGRRLPDCRQATVEVRSRLHPPRRGRHPRPSDPGRLVELRASRRDRDPARGLRAQPLGPAGHGRDPRRGHRAFAPAGRAAHAAVVALAGRLVPGASLRATVRRAGGGPDRRRGLDRRRAARRCAAGGAAALLRGRRPDPQTGARLGARRRAAGGVCASARPLAVGPPRGGDPLRTPAGRPPPGAGARAGAGRRAPRGAAAGPARRLSPSAGDGGVAPGGRRRHHGGGQPDGRMPWPT
ncbi:MAG: ribonuclease H-like domain-containing protein [bacterium]|nr:ribonuclease H-like domain-containing protein [bacterium]